MHAYPVGTTPQATGVVPAWEWLTLAITQGVSGGGWYINGQAAF